MGKRRRGRPESDPHVAPRQLPVSATSLRIRAGLILLAGALTYWNSLSGPFIFDDQLSVVENRQIRQLWPLTSVLFPERELPVAGRPLVNVSFAINYAIGGLEVRGYHVWNVVTHLLCAWLLFGVVRRTLGLPSLQARFGRWSADLAFATALIWVLHPLNTEAVDYLTQRTESMMALFYLLTMYASICAVNSPRAAMWQAASVLSCALGMACKESMVTAPLMVLLYDRVFVFDSLRQAFQNRWRLYAGLAVMWLELAALMWSGPRVHSAGFSTAVRPWTYLLNQTEMIVQYLRLAIWPQSLVLNYGSPRPLALVNVVPYALFSGVLLLLTVVALVLRPKLGFLGTSFFVTLAPTSSIVPIATEVGAERRMYLPLAALIALVVVSAPVVWDRLGRAWSGRAGVPPAQIASIGGMLVLAVVSAALSAGTVLRNREYASGLSLARTVLERRPSSIAHHMVGTELGAAGYHEEAVMHLRKAIHGEPRAHYSLGVELFKEGRLDEAIEQLQEFARREPLLLEVVSARVLMGRAFAMREKQPEAAEQFRLVLTMTPSNAEAQGLLAATLFAQQAFDEAIVHYREYLRHVPNDVAALSNLGIALAASGKPAEAVSTFRRAVEIDPQGGGAHRNLANALLESGDFDEAALHAEQAVALRPDDSVAHDLLGLAFASQGKLDEARVQFERSLQIDPAYAAARENLGRIKRMRNGSPRPR